MEPIRSSEIGFETLVEASPGRRLGLSLKLSRVALAIELSIALFLFATIAIAVAGIRMARIADVLADRTQLGEAVVGGVLLGLSTSLSGTVTSVTAAIQDAPSLAVSNAIGGIAVQTVFLVAADLAYRRANLEHAAADEKNLLQAALLVLLLGLGLAAYMTPEFAIWSVHPVSLLLVAVCVFGIRATVSLSRSPMWQPMRTDETRADVPDTSAMNAPLGTLAAQFAALALVLGVAGYVMAEAGTQISREFGISQTVVGSLMTATATSLPELVTTLAAVRRGALQLAVGGIVGGNTFDVLFLSMADVAYRDGSIFHAMTERDALLLVAAIVMTAILLMGLVLRDRRGIGFEGAAILTTYAGLLALQFGLD